MAKQTKPEPVVVQTICSMCQLDWTAHGEDPTTEDCIRLLKSELAKRPVVSAPVYPVQPWRPPYQPHWQFGGTSAQPITITCQNTPRLAEANC